MRSAPIGERGKEAAVASELTAEGLDRLGAVVAGVPPCAHRDPGSRLPGAGLTMSDISVRPAAPGVQGASMPASSGPEWRCAADGAARPLVDGFILLAAGGPLQRHEREVPDAVPFSHPGQ